MAKLSALSTSANVTLEIGGKTYSCPWLAYNHYGKSEVTLLLLDYSSVNLTTYIEGSNSYFGTIIDNIALLEIPNLMDEGLRKSLVKVSIDDGVRSSVKRSIFAPSVKEIGQTNYSGSATLTYTSTGSVFSTLKSKVSTRQLLMRGRVTGTINASNVGGGTTSVDSYLPFYIPETYLTVTNALSGSGYILSNSGGVKSYGCYGYHDASSVNNNIGWAIFLNHRKYISVASQNYTYLIPYVVDALLICLDGNCEVTGSGSSWTLSKATAIESYRKINGVWYRTI